MKCDKVSFSYRGTDAFGAWLARLLSDISVDYEGSRVSGSADLGGYLRELLLNVSHFGRDIKQAVSQTPPTDYAHYYQWLRDRGFDPHHISDNGGSDNLTMALAKAFPTKPDFEVPVPTIQAPVPTIEVPRQIAWFLQGKNVPLDQTVVLRFVRKDDPDNQGRPTLTELDEENRNNDPVLGVDRIRR